MIYLKRTRTIVLASETDDIYRYIYNSRASWGKECMV